MLDVLGRILCALLALAAWIIDALVVALNAAIAGLAAAGAFAVGLLPSMPDAPAAPTSGVLELANWVFPIGAFLASAAGLLILWTGFLVVRVILRWVKAL